MSSSPVYDWTRRLPTSGNVVDRRYEQPTLANMMPGVGNFPNVNAMGGFYQRQPLTPEQQQWLAMNMPQQMPTTPIAGTPPQQLSRGFNAPQQSSVPGPLAAQWFGGQ